MMAQRTLSRPGPGAAVILLGLSQIIGYGTVYYSIAILAGDIAAEFGWPVSWVMGAFSLALLAGGAMAPFAGRMVDRHGAGPVMTAGSLAVAAALAIASLAPGPIAFTAALVAIELASPFVLYDAAFAALVQLCGARGGLRITHLTLIAGFASTLFWPFTTWLHGALDWRTILQLFAAMNLLVCLPIHAVIARLRPFPEAEETAPTAGGTPERPLPKALQPRAFAFATAGFALSGFLLSATLTQMVPMLAGFGIGAAALWVSTLFGPAQVLVRFVNMLVGVRAHPLTVTLLAAALLPTSALVLMATAPSEWGAAVFAVLLGFGSGLKSITQGTVPLSLFGSQAYGARLGRMAFARHFLAAIAPFAYSGLVDLFGPTIALATFVAVGFAGLAALAEVARIRRRALRDPPAAD
jgi:MFS family permease